MLVVWPEYSCSNDLLMMYILIELKDISLYILECLSENLELNQNFENSRKISNEVKVLQKKENVLDM